MLDDNRRDSYRLSFKSYNALPVALQLPDPAGETGCLCGEMLDLSLGGLGVRVREEEATYAPGTLCIVCFSLPDEKVGRIQMLFQCAVIHCRKEPAGVSYGLRFLPLESSVDEEQRTKSLWNYLLDEQRRALARAKEREELNRSIEEVARQREAEAEAPAPFARLRRLFG